MAKAWHNARLTFVAVVLLAAIWLGLKEGFDGFRDAETPLQALAASTQLLYGAAAAICLLGLFTGRPWLDRALFVWTLALTLTGGLAPVAWGASSWSTGLFAGAVTLAVALLVAWGARAHTRQRPVKDNHPTPRSGL